MLGKLVNDTLRAMTSAQIEDRISSDISNRSISASRSTVAGGRKNARKGDSELQDYAADRDRTPDQRQPGCCVIS